MSADNPTVDDLRTVAANLRAEGHTSRAHLVDNAAAKLEHLEAVEAAAFTNANLMTGGIRQWHKNQRHDGNFADCVHPVCVTVRACCADILEALAQPGEEG
jgi:hypothetical protein